MRTRNSLLNVIVGALLIMAAVVPAGCSTTVMPKDLPLIQGLDTRSLAGASLGIRNAETGSTEYAILNSSGQNAGFVTNRQVWSKKLVEALAVELSRRGAQVRANAPLMIGIALAEIKFDQSRGMLLFKMKVAVSSSAGWSKIYLADAESDPGYFELLDATANRVSGLALVEAVKAIMGDAEFLAQLGKK